MIEFYKCPKCGNSDCLSVQATLDTRIYNTPEGPSLFKDHTTSDDWSPEFDGHSQVTCENCNYEGKADSFIAASPFKPASQPVACPGCGIALLVTANG